MRKGLAAGAADAVFGWMKRPEVRAAGFGEVEGRLREAGKGAAGPIAAAVRGPVEEDRAPVGETPVLLVLPEGVDPAALGERTQGDWWFFFQKHPRTREMLLWRVTLAKVPREDELADDFTFLGLSGDDIYQLAIAQGATRIAAVLARRAPEHVVVIVYSREGRWTISPAGDVPTSLDIGSLLAAFAACGLKNPTWTPISDDAFFTGIEELSRLFEGAREIVCALRDQRLREVDGQFVEPDAAVLSDTHQPVLATLDTWLGSDAQTALVLGEFGTGKSTVLAEWAHRRWEKGDAPLPVLVNLAGVGPHASPEALLLQAARLDDLPRYRAALRLLVRRGHLVPCFDGFDEMATRLEAAELAGRLSALIEVASTGGKVLISSRTNYFSSRDHLRTAADAALVQALGDSAGLMWIELQPFSDDQVKALVRKIRTEEGDADRALDRIAGIYDLRDLVHRPLLLGMVLTTLDALDTGKRIGRADLYDAYLGRWLDQTRKDDPECFTDAQKMTFAEALAEELWRSGEPSCTWQTLQKSVRMRLVPELTEGLPVGAALLEMQGGAFFVHEGEDRYRFAHQSFREYFLARALVATVSVRPAEALATKPITREVAEFVGEILRQTGDPHKAHAVRGVSAWLSGPEGTTPIAAANALRLLLGLSRWAQDGKAWIPEGADLRGVVLVREDLRGASLVRADLSGADLSGADLSEANLSGANLVGARCVGVKLERTTLAGARAQRADFTMAEADDVDLSGVVLTDAVLRQSTWTACRWEETHAEGADVTASAFYGLNAPPAGAVRIAASPPYGEASLVRAHSGNIYALDWHPDGTRLASAGSDRTVRIWDVATGKEIARFEGHRRWVFGVAWHPDGKLLASAGDDGTVRLWDAATGRGLGPLTPGPRTGSPSDWLSDLDWCRDGHCLAIAGRDAAVYLWEVASEKFSRLQGHAKGTNAVTWHPNRRLLASAGHDNFVRLWDAASRRELACFEGHASAVWALAWHPNGETLVSGGDDMVLRQWNIATGKEVAQFRGHTGGIRAVAWSPDGSRLSSAAHDQTIRVWNPATASEITRSEHVHAIGALAWHPAGDRIASGGQDCCIYQWNANTGIELTRIQGNLSGVSAVAWAADGQTFASAGGDRTVRLWDARGGGEIAQFTGHQESITALAWAPQGAHLASTGNDSSLRVWNVATGEEVRRLEGNTNGIRAVAWHPNGLHLATTGGDNTVRLWEVSSGEESARFEGHTSNVMAVAWHPTGERLASAGADNTVRFWDTATRKELSRLEGHAGWVSALAWHPGGEYLASGGQGHILFLWDVATSKPVARLDNPRAWGTALAWSPSGKILAIAAYDGSVFLWNMDAGSEKGLVRVVAHTQMATSVTWNPNGTRFLSSGLDGIIKLWGVSPLTLLAAFEMKGTATLVRTAGGFCDFGSGETERGRLTLHRPEPGSRTVLYLPLAGLRRVLHRPDKIRAALAGDLSGDDIRPELERLGWTNGVPWDGKAHRIPPAAPAPLAVSSAAPTLTRLQGHLDVFNAPRAPSTVTPAAASPAFRENPFSPGPALTGELPPGREPVIQEILALLKKKCPAPAILRGPRRSGKTSILHHLQSRLAKTHHIRLVPVEGRTTPLVTADDLARLVDPSLATDPTPAGTLRKRLQRRRGKRTVLLLDEVANLSGADASLFSWLRALGQEGTGVLLAGSHWDWVRVVERAAAIMPGSSFGNDVTPVTLGPLREEDALQFLVDTAPPDVPLARDGTARWILDRCGPWPFYLQVMGFSIVQAVRQEERKALVEPVGVGDIYEQRLLLDRNDGYFKTRFAELPERARGLLDSVRALPPGDRPVYRDLPPEDRRVLADTGLCTALGAWLEDRPFFDWIVRVKDDGRR